MKKFNEHNRLDIEEIILITNYGINEHNDNILEDEDLERISGGGLPSLIKNCFTCGRSSEVVSPSVKAARRAEWQKRAGVFRTGSSGSTYFEKTDGTRIPVPKSP
jgi:hypothetical protein